MPSPTIEAPALLTLLAASTADGARSQVRVLGREIVVGRSPEASLRIDDLTVARRHCRIFARDGRHHIEDAGSSGGVFVNDEMVGTGTTRPLAHGDRIKIGANVALLVRLPGSDTLGREEDLRFFRQLFGELQSLGDEQRSEDVLALSDELDRYLSAHCYVLAIELDRWKPLAARLGNADSRRTADRVMKAFRALFHAEDLVAPSAVPGRWEIDTMFADDDAALAGAEQLRKHIADTTLTIEAERVHLTASVGLSCEREFPASIHLSPFRRSQEAARERLRLALKRGGDAVCAWDDDQ